MEQRIGPDGIGVQIDGSNNTVTLIAGATRLVLDRRHLAKATPTDERELLLTERRATDLVGREGDLSVLHAWLTTTKPITCRCLIGRAGTGKTRLAIELCERAEAEGWVAGFARHEDLQRLFNQQSLADWHWNKNTLVVVDYAAASREMLRKWLEVLARRRPGAKLLRLLLLERHADREAGWWAELARPGGLSGPGPDALLDPAEPIVLSSLRRVEERRALLAQAMREAARVRHIASPPVLPAPGVDPGFERRLAEDTINNEPLYLIMAGLVAVTTGAPMALALRRVDLAIRVAEAEGDRLNRLASSAGIDQHLFRHLAACVTLQGGCNVGQATQLVEEERRAIGDRTTTRTSELVRELANALPVPGSGDADAVRPDLIGEALLWQHITCGRRRLEEQCAIVERAFARAGTPVVATVVHAAQDFAEGDAAHVTVVWLDSLASRSKDIGTLKTIAIEIPEQTLALRNLALEITGRIVDALRPSVTSDPSRLPDLARWLDSFSLRLSDAGEREKALNASQEAVEAYRALVRARHDAFRPALILSLNNLSLRLHYVGRHEEALTANQGAVDILHDLAKTNPDALHPYLVGPLANLSNRLSDLGRNAKALRVARKAVEFCRTWAYARPDAFRPTLAGSLSNLSHRLFMRYRLGEALAAIREAVTIDRELAATRPDAFRQNLASSLTNLAIVLSDMGEHKEALEAIRESVEIYRTLADLLPDAFRPKLASSLWVLAGRLDEAGDLAAGMAANAEAIAVQRIPFLQLPRAFKAVMDEMVRQYLQRCERLERKPDANLLAPILIVLKSLQQQQGNQT